MGEDLEIIGFLCREATRTERERCLRAVDAEPEEICIDQTIQWGHASDAERWNETIFQVTRQVKANIRRRIKAGEDEK